MDLPLIPRMSAVIPRNIGCPLSSMFSTIRSATSFHFPSGLWVCVPCLLFFLSRTDELPVSSRESFCVVPYLLGILSLSKQYRWTSTWRGLFLQIVLVSFCERSDLLGSFEESAMMCVLGNFPTRTQLVLHRFQIILCTRWFVGSLEVNFSISHSLLNDHVSNFAFVHSITWCDTK